jgi:Peptidase inhibitor I78 family
MEQAIPQARQLSLVFLILAAGPLAAENGNKCHPISDQDKASFKGKSLTSSIQEQLSSISGAAQVRILMPKTAATMEAREGRLNVQVDSDGRILSIWCDLAGNRD